MKKKTGKIDTVLAQWLREASPGQRERLAVKAKTSVGYLRLLAGVHRENPKLRLALAIVEESRYILCNEATKPGLPEITLKDLSNPTRYEYK